MSLVACPECGNRVSDRAEMCPKCGYPLREKTMNSSGGEAVKVGDAHTDQISVISKARQKIRAHVKLVVAIVAAIILIPAVCMFAIPQIQMRQLLQDSKNNIEPYLEHLRELSPSDGGPDFDVELQLNSDKVSFLGLEGKVKYRVNDAGMIDEIIWVSNTSVSEDDFRDMAQELDKLFQSNSRKDEESWGSGITYSYYWEDTAYDCIAIFHHGEDDYMVSGEEKMNEICMRWTTDKYIPREAV